MRRKDRMGPYSCIGQMPSKAERAWKDGELHTTREIIARRKDWTLVRSWTGEFWACHPVHGRFLMPPNCSKRAFYRFVRHGGAFVYGDSE